MLPAHSTKSECQLQHPFLSHIFHLTQRTDGVTNGTALWLGGQLLSLYLADSLKHPHGLRVLELGSGVGLTALALGALGCEVLATDASIVVNTVLNANVSRNSPGLPGIVRVSKLDWHEPIPATLLDEAYDIIVTADTIYVQELVEPLLRTISAVCRTKAIVYVCVERRDGQLLDKSLREAEVIWGFSLERVPAKRIANAMRKGRVHWAREEWEGVEIWKLRKREAVMTM